MLPKREDFTPPLKTQRIHINSITGGLLFHDGSWWQIVERAGAALHLQECTNLQAVQIANNPGVKILLT